MKRKWISVLLMIVMTASMLAGCGSKQDSGTPGAEPDNKAAAEKTDESAPADAKEVNISFYSTQTGIDDTYLDIIDHFEAENPGITVEYIAAGDDQLQKWMSLYASNEGPTVSLMDPINIWENQDRMREMTKEDCPWLDNIIEESLVSYIYNDKLYGIPMSAAGYGLLYNQKVLDEAVGGTFDPSSIKTRSDLEDLFKKIEATGAAGSMFTGVNWSLGSHYLGALVYGPARGDVATRDAFVQAQKSGEANLIDDPLFNGLMDTFDLIAEYNYNKKDPLVGNVNMDAEALVTGKAGTWFMGDWAWVYLADLVAEGDSFGIIPIPYSDDPDDKFNTSIPLSYPKGYCVDASQNTEEQQEAGLKFIEYITSNEYAQKVSIDVGGQALPYKNCTAEIKSPLGQATQKYISEGKAYDIYDGSVNGLPSDFWYECGAYTCEYLAGACDRKQLSEKVGSYWKALEN